MRIEPLEPGTKLSLTNDGALELFFLGVGSAFAEENNQTNFLIVKGDDHILVDCGETGPMAIKHVAGLAKTDIGVILPTHSHPDHVNGVATLGLANRYVGIPFMKKPKTRMIINEEYQRVLWTHTLQGALEWNERPGGGSECLGFSDFYQAVRPHWVTYQPREAWEVDIGDIHVEMFRTKHIPEQSDTWEASFISYGMMIDDEVFVSGDTRFDPDLIDIYRDRARVMFHDVQFFPGAVHAPLGELKTLPEDVKKKMYLVHYADNWRQQDITGFAGWTQQGVRYIFD